MTNNRACLRETVPARIYAGTHTDCTATAQGQISNYTFHLCFRRQLEIVSKIATKEEVEKLVVRLYSYLWREFKAVGAGKQ